MKALIHSSDRRAYMAFTSLVFLGPSFHLYSKPKPPFQKSNTQSPNTNYKQISSCLKFIKNVLIKRFIPRAFTQTSAWSWQRHRVITKSSLVISVCFVPS